MKMDADTVIQVNQLLNIIEIGTKTEITQILDGVNIVGDESIQNCF